MRGFVKNFTDLYRPKLGDGPDAVYLLRTQCLQCMHANATSHWWLSGSCAAYQTVQYLKNFKPHYYVSMWIAGVLKVEILRYDKHVMPFMFFP